jgi:glutamate racemase
MSKKSECPIGIFDSGVGGLTVMREIVKRLPREKIMYFGDTAHVPYGSKSKETIQTFSLDIARFLMTHHIKMLVVACNTASSFALSMLQKTVPIPVVGVIDPGVEAALSHTKTNRVGVIGTSGTIHSQAYQKRLYALRPRIKVFSAACPLFVPLVEEAWMHTKTAHDIADVYLKDLKKKKIDTLILGCTHYPLLKKTISMVMGDTVCVVDSAYETAKKVEIILQSAGMLAQSSSKKSWHFFVSDDPLKFRNNGKAFFRNDIGAVKKVHFDQ